MILKLNDNEHLPQSFLSDWENDIPMMRSTSKVFEKTSSSSFKEENSFYSFHDAIRNLTDQLENFSLNDSECMFFFSIDHCSMLHELSLASSVQIVPNNFPSTTSNMISSSSSSSRNSFSQIFALLIIFIFGLIFGHLIKTTVFQNLLLHQYLFISDFILFFISVNLYENEKMSPSHVKKENVC